MNNKGKRTPDVRLDISLTQQIAMSMNGDISIMNKNRVLELSNQDEIFYLQPESILYVQADGNYCDIHLTDGDVLETVGFQRAEVARRIDKQLPREIAQRFALVGKPYLVNITHIMHINAPRQQLTFDINQPGTCKKKSIKASVESLRNLRRNMEAPTVVEHRQNHTNGRINGGFTDYKAMKRVEDKNYEIGDDEVMMLGQ